MSVAFVLPARPVEVATLPRLQLVGGNPAACSPTGATWGGLLVDAESDARAAAQLLVAGRLPSRPAAVEAMSAYADVLAAAAPVWRALWAGAAAPPPPAVARLGRTLATRPAAAATGPASSAVATLWRSAAVSVRSAADLLATHRSPDGRWRSPESTVLAESGVLVAGSRRLAEVLLTVLAAGPDLTGRLADHGIGAGAARRALGGLGPLQAAARGCVRRAGPLPAGLAELGLARPAVATEVSAAALADRLARVRRSAWELAACRRVPVTSLAAIAACAVDVCSSTGDRAGQAPWRQARGGLAQLRTLTPPAATLLADAAAARWLLRAGVPADAARPVVEDAAARLPELARWGAAAFSRIATSDLYLLGSALGGAEVSEHPELARAKLTGRVVLAPYDRIAAVAAAYAAAAQR